MDKIKQKYAAIIAVVMLYSIFFIYYGLSITSEKSMDFPTFYFSAKASITEGISPYDAEGIKDAVTPVLRQDVYPFIYAPPALFAFIPFTIFSYHYANIIMIVINHLCLLLLMYLLFFRIIDLKGKYLMLVIGSIFFFENYAVIFTVRDGQVNIITMLLVVLAWVSMKEKKSEILTAGLIVAAGILKTYPLIFLLYFVLAGKYKAFAWGLIFLLLASVASFIVFPDSYWVEYLRLAMASGGYGNVLAESFSSASTWNQSLNGFLSRLFIPNSFCSNIINAPIMAKILGYLIAIVMLVVSGYAVFKNRNKINVNNDFALFILLWFVIAPVSWGHHLVFVLPVAFIALYSVLSEKVETKVIIWVAGGVFLVWFNAPHLFPYLKKGILSPFISLHFFGVLLIWWYYIKKMLK